MARNGTDDNGDTVGPAPEINDAAMAVDRTNTSALIAAEPLVTVMVPFDMDDTRVAHEGGKVAPLVVWINGVQFEIPKNEQVQVPAPVAAVVQNYISPVRIAQYNADVRVTG